MPDILENKSFVAIILLTLVGAALRVWQLTRQSLWLDEVFTYHLSQLSMGDIWTYVASATDVHPPVFYWIEHIALILMVNTEFALRIFPMIFGILTIPVFYLIGNELESDIMGIIMAALITFSPFAIFYSQEARMYSLLILVFSLALLFYIKLYNYYTHKYIKWNICAFAILSSLCIWVHFYSIIIIAIMWCFLLYRIYTTKNNTVIIMALIADLGSFIITLPMLMLEFFVITTPGNPFFIGANRGYGYEGFDIVTRTLSQMFGNSAVVSITLVFLMMIGIAYIVHKYKDVAGVKPNLIIISWASIIISCLLSYKIPIETRYLSTLFPIFCIFVAYSIIWFISVSSDRYKNLSLITIITLCIGMIVIINTPALTFHYTNYDKPDWKGVVSEIHRMEQPGYSVVLIPAGNREVMKLYYQSQNTTLLFANNIDELVQLNSTHTIFISTGDLKYNDKTGEIQSWLNKNTKFVNKVNTFSIYVKE